MKKTIIATGLMLALAAAPAMAQMMGGQVNPEIMEQQQRQQSASTGGQYYNQYMYPGMMGNYGYGMGPQMMGYYGHGMGPGMMMSGYGMHNNMMGGGCYGMGPQMMGNYGYGMGPGMTGYYSPEQYEKQYKENQQFLDETKELRKKLHALKFDYAEALRNPESKSEGLEKINAEMENIWKQIYEKKNK